MYNFIYSSITDEAKLMVLSDFADYTLMINGIQITNGPCFLKVLIRNTTVDTRSTVYHLRENLNHLENFMVEITYDIDQFNLYVTNQVEQLAARGESSSDLLVNLFAAYLAVPDRKFVEYVEKQKDKYDKGEDISPKLLMQIALTKFKDRTRAGKWQAPSADEAQIIALKAELQDIKANNKAGKGKENAGNTDGNHVGKKIGNKTKKSDNANNKYAWKLVPPATGEPKTKVVNEKEYHFCPNHNEEKGAWVLHNPNQCNASKLSGSTSSKQPGKQANKALALSKALQAIQEEDDYSSDEE
jgi:hypothetical protein